MDFATLLLVALAVPPGLSPTPLAPELRGGIAQAKYSQAHATCRTSPCAFADGPAASQAADAATTAKRVSIESIDL